MDVYQGWFSLREGYSAREVRRSLQGYMAHLQDRGLIATWRLLRRKLGPAVLGEFHFLVETNDLAQLDAAFRAVSARAGEVDCLHHALNSKVEDAVFALYRDFPGAHRQTGEERF